MKKQRCRVQIISISRKGEVKHFQVKVPENAKVITGIETAVRMKGIQNFGVLPVVPNVPNANGGFPLVSPFVGVSPPNPFGAIGNDAVQFRSSLVGELKLQSYEEANVFYATNVTDPSANENLDRIQTPSEIIENVWTHGYKRELEEVLIYGNTTVLAGLYRDKLGAMQNRDASYDVFLYVWYKLKTKKDDNKSCS